MTGSGDALARTTGVPGDAALPAPVDADVEATASGLTAGLEITGPLPASSAATVPEVSLARCATGATVVASLLAISGRLAGLLPLPTLTL